MLLCNNLEVEYICVHVSFLMNPLVCCRKHALNCHRMKPALFNVLCEIKEKTGTLIFSSALS